MKLITQIIFLFIFAATAQGASKLKLKIGDIPPSYIGKDTHGNKINLEDHRGKIVVISFWATWCAPCLKELPVLNAIQQAVSKDHLRVFAINYRESKRVFNKIKKELVDFHLTITRDRKGSIGRKFGVKGIPHLLIIGGDGKITYQNVGYGEGTTDKMVKIINEQLKTLNRQKES